MIMVDEITAPNNEEGYVQIEAGTQKLDGTLRIPEEAIGVVLFVHGSGNARTDPRNLRVAEELHQARLATLLVNLVTQEELGDNLNEELEMRFDLPMLMRRVAEVTAWVRHEPLTQSLKIGYFAASTGAAAAVAAAAELGNIVRAIVSCDGRPDLATAKHLKNLRAPILLIVGEGEAQAHFLNRQALEEIGASEKHLVQIPGGTDLLEGPGERDEVARLAADWFKRFIIAGASPAQDEQPQARTEETTMAAKTGETARGTGDFRCSKCHTQVHVTQGDKIPKCPKCGNETFDTRYHEPRKREAA